MRAFRMPITATLPIATLSIVLALAAGPALGETVQLENRSTDTLSLTSGGRVLCAAKPNAVCSAKMPPGSYVLGAVTDDKRAFNQRFAVTKGGLSWRVQYQNPPPEYHVQAASFRVRVYAFRLRVRLLKLGAPEVKPVPVKGKTYWRVRVGPVRSRAAAEAIRAKIVAMGYADALLVRY